MEMCRVIYDWDSLALERETVIVGEAARGFTMTWHLDVLITPSQNEACASVSEYETYRGKAFTSNERTTIAAATTYALAYGARCEHCIDPRTSDFPAGSAREALAHYGEDYLAPDLVQCPATIGKHSFVATPNNDTML